MDITELTLGPSLYISVVGGGAISDPESFLKIQQQGKAFSRYEFGLFNFSRVRSMISVRYCYLLVIDACVWRLDWPVTAADVSCRE